MKIWTKLFFTFIIVFFFFLLVPKTVFAKDADYEPAPIQPVLFIPSDWKDKPVANGQYYAGDIKNALQEVQQFFAKNLNGKTFQVGGVEVVYSSRSTEDASRVALDRMFEHLDGDTLLPRREGVLYLVWIVGSANLTEGIGSVLPDRNPSILFNHADLVDLYGSDNLPRRTQLGLIAYSIAQALVDVHDRQTNPFDRACSVISTDFCPPDASSPLPPADEYTEGVISGGNYDKFPNLKFNNSIYNPEIAALYKSPFINPQGDPAPEPTAVPVDTLPEITSVSPTEVHAGDTIEIEGKHFGTEGDLKVFFAAYPLLLIETPTFSVLEWDDTHAKVVLQDSKERDFDIPFGIGVHNITKIPYGEKHRTGFFEPGNLILKGGLKSPSTIEITGSVLCGPEKTPVPNVLLLIHRGDPQRQKNTAYIGFTSDENGSYQYIFSVDDPNQNQAYFLRPNLQQAIEPIEANPAYYPISLPNVGSSISVNTSFTYANCPEGVINPTPLPPQEEQPDQRTVSPTLAPQAPQEPGVERIDINGKQVWPTVSTGVTLQAPDEGYNEFPLDVYYSDGTHESFSFMVNRKLLPTPTPNPIPTIERNQENNGAGGGEQEVQPSPEEISPEQPEPEQ